MIDSLRWNYPHGVNGPKVLQYTDGYHWFDVPSVCVAEEQPALVAEREGMMSAIRDMEQWIIDHPDKGCVSVRDKHAAVIAKAREGR